MLRAEAVEPIRTCMDKAMAITFRPENAEIIEVTSPHFNPEEAENAIYNPRYEIEYICPVLTTTNAKAFSLMQKLGIKESYEGEHCDIEALLQQYRKLYAENDVLIRNYGLRLERVLLTCIKTKSKLIWS